MKWIVIVNFYQVNCDGKNIFVVKNFVEFNNFCFDDFTWNFSSTYFGFLIVLQSLYFTIDSLYENCWKIFDEKFLLVKL